MKTSAPRDLATSSRRLLKLAAFLDQLPRKRFDYAEWVGPEWEGAPDLSCGTTACALGWAAAMPEFRRLGLHLVTNVRPWRRVRFGRWFAVEAGAQFFRLSTEDAYFLFNPRARHLIYPWQAPGFRATPQRVANHIRRFLDARAARDAVSGYQTRAGRGRPGPVLARRPGPSRSAEIAAPGA